MPQAVRRTVLPALTARATSGVLPYARQKDGQAGLNTKEFL